MPRSYAHIVTAIWIDAFRTLQSTDQRTYLMLVTQPDISAAGVLALRARRWSTYAPDTTPDDITASLARLADAGCIVIDRDEEELLIRDFVRHDNGYTNSKRRLAIMAAAHDVRSAAIRDTLIAEFRQLRLPTDDLEGSIRRVGIDAVPHDGHPHVDGPSDVPSNGARVVDTNGKTGSPAAFNPQPPPPRPQPPEHEARSPETVAALVEAVRGIRPEWSPRSIRRALTHTDVLARPWPAVCNAAIVVAEDCASQVPGRLPHDGPWWTPPAPSSTARPSPPGPPDWRSLPDYGSPRRTSTTSAAAAHARHVADTARPIRPGRRVPTLDP